MGSGKYEFPFEMAVKIAIGGIGNALIDWKQKDPEAFSDKTEGLQNIVFFVYPDECGKGDLANEVLKEYKEIYQQDDQAVMFNSFQSQIQYIYEIKRYDIQRGYFFIARSLRALLAYIRLIFIWTYFKDIYGKRNWQKRRLAVECTTVFKMLFPFISWVLIRHCVLFQGHVQETVLYGIICYNLVDTLTYLVMLIVMADIQNPSANIIRSLILLAFNYLEMAFTVAYFYYLYYRGRDMYYREALKVGLLGGEASKAKMDTIYEYLLLYANAGLKFFFVTLVFGYFVGHMRQRKFRT